jgi:uncharacterized protein
MKKALIVHAWYNSPENNWYPWLKNELERKGYSVTLPDFTELRKDVPELITILTQIEKTVKPDNDTVVVGHSLGCLVALRLAEKLTLKKVVLVSGWDFNDLTEGHRKFWKTKLNHAKIMKNVSEIVVIHSSNDPYITASQAEDMCKRFKGKFVLVKDAGHITAKDGYTKLPAILQFL